MRSVCFKNILPSADAIKNSNDCIQSEYKKNKYPIEVASSMNKLQKKEYLDEGNRNNPHVTSKTNGLLPEVKNKKSLQNDHHINQ